MAGLRQQVVAGGLWETAEEAPFDRARALTPRGVTPWDGSEQRLARLARTIESEVVPRLLLARRAAPTGPVIATADDRFPSGEEVAEFAGLVLAREAALADHFIAALRGRGMSAETLYLDLLAPTARHLGELWDADLRSFTEVTLGLLRLHQVLHDLSPAFQNPVEHQTPGLRALLVPAPGEQHLFGLVMVTEFFRRAGWDVASGPVATSDELTGLVRRERFDVVGISVGCGTRCEALASTIRALRRASRNRTIGVMVGGPMFVEHPELAALVGADATAVDGRQAVVQARSLLDLLPSRC